jgi:NTP pyrophosphatase (non-canonical NTP hydrolase)
MSEHGLAELQAVVDHWIREHGGYWDEWANLARLFEEAGEVSAAFQRLRGWRPRPEAADLAGELGDVLWVLLVIANQQGVSLAEAFEATLAKVTQRDGEAWRRWAAERAEG